MEDIIQLNPDYQILICRLCQAAVRPGAGIESHFRFVHQLKGQVLKDIKDYFSILELADPKLIAVPEDNSPAVEQLAVSDGYSCNACRYLTIARDNIVRHWREAGHGAAEERWTQVRLQTWIGARNHTRYWIVRDDSDIDGPADTATVRSRGGNSTKYNKTGLCTLLGYPCTRMAGYRGDCCKTPEITASVLNWVSGIFTSPRSTLHSVPQLEFLDF